jgi:hypothetical protein
VPRLASVDIEALTLSVLAVVLVFVVRAGILATLAACAGAGLLWLYAVGP